MNNKLNLANKVVISAIGALVLTVPIAVAQSSTPAPLAFEVASIRVHEGPLSRMKDFSSSGPRLRLEGYNAMLLIMEAYNLKQYQMPSTVQAPWQYDKFFDILANAPGDTTPTKAEFRRMLQLLLADRFKLTMHRETREMPVYALVVGKNGPKFKESVPGGPIVANHGVNGRNQNMDLSHSTMDHLAEELGGFVDLPVIDKTGLTGTYVIKLEATPRFRINNNPQPTDISAFDAVQDVLGLKLEKQTAPIEVFVLDHIEQPSQN